MRAERVKAAHRAVFAAIERQAHAEVIARHDFMVRKLVAPTHHVPTTRIARRAAFHARAPLQLTLPPGRGRTIQRIRRVIENTSMPLSFHTSRPPPGHPSP